MTDAPHIPIEGIRIEGFKSFRDPVEVSIRPLTVLAGQNSAGKSTLLQPLLLAKQTLEATFDPGTLLLDGPCYRGARADDLLWRGPTKADRAERWSFSILREGMWAGAAYRAGPNGVTLDATEIESAGRRTVLANPPYVDWGLTELLVTIGSYTEEDGAEFDRGESGPWPGMRATPGRVAHELTGHPIYRDDGPLSLFGWMTWSMLYLPGLRGQAERSYPATRAHAERFSGPFTPYTAGVLLTWQDAGDDRVRAVADALQALGLTSRAEVVRLPHTDAAIEVKVGRLVHPRRGGSKDLVNLADVGVGVSQVLPVVVALLAAESGALVHIEQPELHLHPAAQVRMAALLVAAAKRGARVVVETHSSVLLTAIQLAVAKDEIPAEHVALHWFSRDADGASKVTTAELGADGTFGEWPVDFADVELDIASRFVDASFAQESG